MPTTILWLRRDLRREDHPALRAAHEAADGGMVLPLFVLDPRLLDGAGTARRAALRDALDRARSAYDDALVVRVGDPADVLPQVAAQIGAASVHVSGESTPYGRRRGRRVREALERADVTMTATGTPYAVSPGRVRKADGTPYAVFTPFARAWRDVGWPRPEPEPRGLRWCRRLDPTTPEALAALPDRTRPPSDTGSDTGTSSGSDSDTDSKAGRAAAQEQDPRQRWQDFLDEDLAGYGSDRDRPDLDRTSRMSEHLKFGAIHPRTMLADLADHPDGRSPGAQTFVTELAWREFYADVLWHHPRSAWRDLRPSLAGLAYDDPASDPVAAQRFAAWQEGRTGYPIVDAGMRQLLAQGWMHNRVRMIVASFLTKDLHLWWPHGARHFLAHLRDGDLASNNHGWQWVAGTGTDAAPYFRVFNPTTQGEKFDPHGDYVRRYVPELAHLPGRAVHTPWKHPAGGDHGYPPPIVDHGAERRETLARYERR